VDRQPDRTLIELLSNYDRLVEVGIGRRTAVAGGLTECGCTVTATDITDRHASEIPTAVEFVIDDICTPNDAIYRNASAIYALNLPPELHRPTRAVARRVGVSFYFTTLGGDPPTIPVEPQQLPLETLYRCRER